MSEYAKVLNGKVLMTIVADENYLNSYKDNSPGTWIKTDSFTYANQSTNGGVALRANYASEGYTYDAINDVFYAPQPYPSWTISAPTWIWQPPIPMPTDGKLYVWDETTKTWVAQ
jgi:hypothetical protein